MVRKEFGRTMTAVFRAPKPAKRKQPRVSGFVSCGAAGISAPLPIFRLISGYSNTVRFAELLFKSGFVDL